MDRNVINRLNRVEAKLAITDLIHASAYAGDRRDSDGMRRAYWPEARLKHASFDGTIDAFMVFAAEVRRDCLFAAHHLSNVMVEVNGDHALAQSYFLAHLRRVARSGEGEEDAFFEGRYIDRLERRGERWGIISRRGFFDHSAVVPATTPYSAWPAGVHSRFHPDDDYYRLLAAFRGESDQ